METAIVSNKPLELTKYDQRIADAGRIADEYADANAFASSEIGKADNTKIAHKADLETFAVYLHTATGTASTITAEELYDDPQQWRIVTYGLLEGFKRWLLLENYAIHTINRKFATVKKFAKMAYTAGVLSDMQKLRIDAVHGFTKKEATYIDKQRTKTRKGYKKAKHTLPTLEQVRALKNQPDTPQGNRDAIIICMLADHGLRVGELAALDTKAFDLKAGTFTFYREKVQKEQTHKLTADSLRVIANWLDRQSTEPGPLLRASLRNGTTLTHRGLTIQAITRRVRTLGARIGLENLGSHDLRHYWATDAVHNGTPFNIVMEAGGWSNWAMVLLYAEADKIANEGIKQTL